ncbi:MAG: hypothetical protein K1X47_00225 [Cyclobacteriaceae bacterium]|nr:hypothetical protein [Cyclobacteriaceae bacterium]
MKKLLFIPILLFVFSCAPSGKKASQIEGTWQLLSGTLIEKGDTVFTDYTKNVRMIKIISPTHFAFFNHDLQQGKDSTAVYFSGGGRYELKGDQYTEHLEYCTDRVWEGHDFSFTITLHQDTLTQQGIERIESAGVDRLNIEKYVRLK